MDTPQVDAPQVAPFSLANLSPDQRTVWREAYQSGYLAGHEAGWAAADAHAASIFGRAVDVVHRMAGLPEVDPEEVARRKNGQDAMRRRLWPEQMAREDERLGRTA